MMDNKEYSQVLAIGNLNVDFLLKMSKSNQIGRRNTGESFSLTPGGNASNQAVAAVRMGVSVSLMGRIGNDTFGEQFVEKMLSENISCDLIRVCSKASTGLSMILVKAGSENTHIDVKGANDQVSEKDIEESKDHIAGSKALLIGLGVPQATVMRTLEIAAQSETQVIFSSTQSAKLPDKAFGMIDVLVIGSIEAADLLGFEVENLKSARIAASVLLGKGIKRAVVIHITGKCVLIATDEGFETVEAPADMEIADSTAMEDTLAGVLAACLVKGRSICDAVEIAYYAASLCGSRVGAQATIPTKEQLAKLESSI